MWYIIGQVLVCLLLTAALGMFAGWLARGYHSRAELGSMQRQLQRQARDLRSRATASAKDSSSDVDKRVQQQLRHQLVRLQGQVEQREKEIAQLRRVLGEQRTGRTPAPADAPREAGTEGTPGTPRKRTPG